jgi:hypothetical protein
MPDWNKLRDDFPIATKYAYLANAAIAPSFPLTTYDLIYGMLIADLLFVTNLFCFIVTRSVRPSIVL